MRGFDDLLFLLDFNVFTNVHSPVKHNWFIVRFSSNRLTLFLLSFLKNNSETVHFLYQMQLGQAKYNIEGE